MRFLLKTIFWCITIVSGVFALKYFAEYQDLHEALSMVLLIVFGILSVTSLVCVHGVKHRCPKCHKWFAFDEANRKQINRELDRIATDGKALYRTTYDITIKCKKCGYYENKTEEVTDQETKS
ncbi:MAG: hypothetical protein MJ009_02800 [Paludibacteraceae bacterium]|nr:hypothetical protein [Paludibacteraceae bacterium]